MSALLCLADSVSNCSGTVISSTTNNTLGLSTLSFCAHFLSRTLNHLKKSLPHLLCFLSLRKHVLHFCLSASLIPQLTRVNTECKVLWWLVCGIRADWDLTSHTNVHMCLHSFLCVCVGNIKLYGHVCHLLRTGSLPTRPAKRTPHPLSTFKISAPCGIKTFDILCPCNHFLETGLTECQNELWESHPLLYTGTGYNM